jgi:hypothetical protein
VALHRSRAPSAHRQRLHAAQRNLGGVNPPLCHNGLMASLSSHHPVTTDDPALTTDLRTVTVPRTTPTTPRPSATVTVTATAEQSTPTADLSAVTAPAYEYRPALAPMAFPIS